MIRPAQNLTLPAALLPQSTGEIVGMRGHRHKTYGLTGGRRAVVLGQDIAHKPDGTELDFTPVRQGPTWIIEQETSTIEMPAGRGPPIIRLFLGNGDRIRVELIQVGGVAPTDRRPDVNPQSHLAWRNVATDTHIVVIPHGRRFKTIRRCTSSSAPLVWRWEILVDNPDSTPAKWIDRLVGWDADGDRLQLTLTTLTDERTTRTRDGQTIPVRRVVIEESCTGQAAKIVDPQTRRRDWRPASYPLRVDPTFVSSVNAGGDDIKGLYLDFTPPIANPPAWSANSNAGTTLSMGFVQGTGFASRGVPGLAFDLTLPISAAITTAKLSGYAGVGATGAQSCNVRGDRQTQGVSPVWATGSGPWVQVGTAPQYNDTNFWPGAATNNWARLGAGIMTSLVKAIIPATPLTAALTTKIRFAAMPLATPTGRFYAFEHTSKPAPKLTIVYAAGGGGTSPKLTLMGVG